jgi:hypothetical protein
MTTFKATYGQYKTTVEAKDAVEAQKIAARYLKAKHYSQVKVVVRQSKAE